MPHWSILVWLVIPPSSNWNKVGKPIRTSRENSFGQMWPYGDQTGNKIDKKYPFDHTNRVRGPILGWMGWNKVGTPMRTSRQTSLGHLQDPECPNCGTTGARGHNRLNIAL